MEKFDNFWTEGTSKKEFKKQLSSSSSSTDAFELRTKHKNPFYTSTDNETNDEEEMNTPKIAFKNYRKMGRKSMQKTFGEEATKKPIYLQLMLDGKVPMDQLMGMKMPQELKNELCDWEAKFPDLRVDGKCADAAGHAAREMRILRRQIARNIAEEHLWPELRAVLSTKKVKQQEEHRQKLKKSPGKSKLPKKDGANCAGGEEIVKLPPINSNFK